jgi:hypothetical protein
MNRQNLDVDELVRELQLKADQHTSEMVLLANCWSLIARNLKEIKYDRLIIVFKIIIDELQIRFQRKELTDDEEIYYQAFQKIITSVMELYGYPNTNQAQQTTEIIENILDDGKEETSSRPKRLSRRRSSSITYYDPLPSSSSYSSVRSPSLSETDNQRRRSILDSLQEGTVQIIDSVMGGISSTSRAQHLLYGSGIALLVVAYHFSRESIDLLVMAPMIAGSYLTNIPGCSTELGAWNPLRIFCSTTGTIGEASFVFAETLKNLGEKTCILFLSLLFFLLNLLITVGFGAHGVMDRGISFSFLGAGISTSPRIQLSPRIDFFQSASPYSPRYRSNARSNSHGELFYVSPSSSDEDISGKKSGSPPRRQKSP